MLIDNLESPMLKNISIKLDFSNIEENNTKLSALHQRRRRNWTVNQSPKTEKEIKDKI